MVLGSDVTASGTQINTRLIHSTISILEFVRLGTRSQGQQLIPKTDTKDGTRWIQCQGVLNGFDSLGTHGRISGSIGEEESIPWDVGGVGFQVVVEWNDGQAHFVGVDEVADDVELHTTVVGDNVGGVGVTVDGDGFSGDFSDEVAFVGIGELRVGVGRVLFG